MKRADIKTSTANTLPSVQILTRLIIRREAGLSSRLKRAPFLE
jgi:hypothetical protein